jgi:hypothetical protein
MYAIAATAAGVELLSLVQPAQAKIIYTPVHKVIKDGQPYSLDLNHDRITDFTITYSDGTGTVQRYFVQEKAAPGNSVVSYPATIVCASALKRGAPIGRGRKFHNGTADLRFSSPSNVFCPWVNVANRFLGLRFKIKGKTHYGWARLSVLRTPPTHTVTITGYAYETIVGKSIIAGRTEGPENIVGAAGAALTVSAPQSATLGWLAMGAPGLSMWRREESVGAGK